MGNVVLISTYEMGRQPFGLASPAALLRAAGARVTLQDLAVSHFDPESVRRADLVGFFVPMHTATRLAVPVAQRVRELNEAAHICFYGLYAAPNEGRLRDIGADTVIGGEFEGPLVDLYRSMAGGGGEPMRRLPTIELRRAPFDVPDRTGLPPLDAYARLRLGEEERVVAATEATRGCKHTCRHCPVVPVYGGRFIVVPPDVVVADVARQVAAGARHVTFGDPDFFNGPAHSLRIVRRLHDEFPDLSYDVTIKVEHLARHANLLPELAATGCVLVTSAIESFDPAVLDKLDKRHTPADFDLALDALRRAGLALNATFVPFTPWTSLEGYGALLEAVAEHDLVDHVAPIQYAVRLLVTGGSRLLELDDIARLVGPFDPEALVHPWAHPDPAVDGLQAEVLSLVEQAQASGDERRGIFRAVWDATRRAAGLEEREPPLRDVLPVAAVPFLTEPWFC
jgi:radical SAM superfamily enzyme YgiQ (UPF0313 family)